MSSPAKKPEKKPAADRTKYELENPISHGDEEITELKFRELQLGDLSELSFKFDGSGAEIKGEMLVILVGKLTGQPDAVVKKIRGKDLVGVATTAGGFILDILPTGDKQSES